MAGKYVDELLVAVTMVMNPQSMSNIKKAMTTATLGLAGIGAAVSAVMKKTSSDLTDQLFRMKLHGENEQGRGQQEARDWQERSMLLPKNALKDLQDQLLKARVHFKDFGKVAADAWAKLEISGVDLSQWTAMLTEDDMNEQLKLLGDILENLTPDERERLQVHYELAKSTVAQMGEGGFREQFQSRIDIMSSFSNQILKDSETMKEGWVEIGASARIITETIRADFFSLAKDMPDLVNKMLQPLTKQAQYANYERMIRVGMETGDKVLEAAGHAGIDALDKKHGVDHKANQKAAAIKKAQDWEEDQKLPDAQKTFMYELNKLLTDHGPLQGPLAIPKDAGLAGLPLNLVNSIMSLYIGTGKIIFESLREQSAKVNEEIGGTKPSDKSNWRIFRNPKEYQYGPEMIPELNRYKKKIPAEWDAKEGTRTNETGTPKVSISLGDIYAHDGATPVGDSDIIRLQQMSAEMIIDWTNGISYGNTSQGTPPGYYPSRTGR